MIMKWFYFTSPYMHLFRQWSLSKGNSFQLSLNRCLLDLLLNICLFPYKYCKMLIVNLSIIGQINQFLSSEF